MLAFITRELFAYYYPILRGASVSILMLSVNVLKPFLFGRGFIGGISGSLSVVSVIGSAIGPLYFGIAYDATGGYTGTLLISAILPATAAILALFLKRPKLTDGAKTALSA